MCDGAFDPGAVLAALARHPPLPQTGSRLAVVGGFVRDTWLHRTPRELDLVVEGDAGALARSIGGEVTVHDAFGTATATGPGWSVDIAMARTERYAQPGALPEVMPATIEEDLARRDFTVNAIAVTVPGGELLAADNALADLAARRLRVLHEHSFVDDPTRVMRLARYAERLGFGVEPGTAARAEQATLETLSGARIGSELRLILGEPDPVAVLERLAGKLPIAAERRFVQSALALAPPDADTSMLILGAVCRDRAWLDGLELTAAEREIAVACVTAETPADTRASALWRAWHRVPVEAVAVAGARGDADAARRWITELREVRLAIGGDDLIDAGVPEGPLIGEMLERALTAKLDGTLDGGRDAELDFALGR